MLNSITDKLKKLWKNANKIDGLFSLSFFTKTKKTNEKEFDHKTPSIPILLFQRLLNANASIESNPGEAKSADLANSGNTNINSGMAFMINETDTKSQKETSKNEPKRHRKRKFKSGFSKSKGRGA